MHTLRLQLAPCTLSCQTPSETSCKRRAAALGGQRAGSLHRASTTWGQRETASCLRAAELGGSSFFFQESHTSSSSHPLLLQTFPYHGHPLLCLALAENRSSELHRGAGDTLQRVSISYCKALLRFVVLFFFFSPSQTPHCSAAFPSLHLSFPFLGCAAPGSQLCSQGTPQSRAAPLLRGMPHRTRQEGITEGLSSPALSTLLHSCWEGPSFSPHLPDLPLAVESPASISPCTAVLISSTESKTKASCDQKGSSCVLGH